MDTTFDIDTACKEALDRVRNSIHADAHNHRVHVRLAFAEASRQMVGRWIYDDANAVMRRLAREWAENTHAFGKTGRTSWYGRIRPPQNCILQAFGDQESS